MPNVYGIILFTTVSLASAAQWSIFKQSGEWCAHQRIEKHIYPRTEKRCLQWCASNNRKFCMWDRGTRDGFCMASFQCSKVRMAGDRRRYNIWLNNNYKAWSLHQSDGRWCNHPRLEKHVYPKNENRCLKWCYGNKERFCMWDYGVKDGFCMASNKCTNTLMAGDRRRYRIWESVITPQWSIFKQSGEWCAHQRIEKNIYPRTEKRCLQWCATNNRKFCMWDRGTRDGFCMASFQCSKVRMAGDRRRYNIWQKTVTNGIRF